MGLITSTTIAVYFEVTNASTTPVPIQTQICTNSLGRQPVP